MDINIGQTLFQFVDAALESTLVTGTAKVMLGVGAIFGTMWLIHFTLRNIQWLYQGMNVVFKDVVFEIAKMAFIAACAFNVVWYVQTIVPFVTGFPSWMGGILSGQEGEQINQIDTLINSYVGSLKKLIAATPFSIWDDFDVMMLGVLSILFFLMGGIPLILVSVGTLVVLKAATTVMLAVGRRSQVRSATVS